MNAHGSFLFHGVVNQPKNNNSQYYEDKPFGGGGVFQKTVLLDEK
jgi:hypothetical protein